MRKYKQKFGYMNCSISFLSKVWEKSENKKHQFRIQELFELKGLKYISPYWFYHFAVVFKSVS